MKNIIFTCSDLKYGNFLINHWLKSLKETNNLSNTDIVILDYGLSARQKSRLKKEKVTLLKCKRNGHVVTIRFRDMKRHLLQHRYDQVLSIDSGDIIFQEDITPIFNNHKKDYRAVYLDFDYGFGEVYIKAIKKSMRKKLKNSFRNRKMINGGVIVGPAKKFVDLCGKVLDLVENKQIYGPDQIAVDYILHEEGFKRLDKTYNFTINSSKKFFIKNGVFYFMNNKKIAIVHNAGATKISRSIRNFGYGPNYNKLKKLTYFTLKNTLRSIDFVKARLKSKHIRGKKSKV